MLLRNVWKNYKNNIILNYVDYVRRFINTPLQAASIKDARFEPTETNFLQLLNYQNDMTLVEYKTYVSIAVRRFRARKLLTDLMSAPRMISSSMKPLDNFTWPDEPRYRDFLRPNIVHMLLLLGVGVNVSKDRLQSHMLKTDLRNLFVLLWYMASIHPSCQTRVRICSSAHVICSTSHGCVWYVVPGSHAYLVHQSIRLQRLSMYPSFKGKVFRLESRVDFRLKGYTFDNMIRTDGHSICLQFVATSQIDIKSRQKTILARCASCTSCTQSRIQCEVV